MSFQWLAERRQFDAILQTVQRKRHNRGSVIAWLHASSSTPLHTILQHHPPTPLFITLLCYSPVTQIDIKSGRNLLHTACLHNCHVSVVAHLLKSLAASTPDTLLVRLPLHWNCAATAHRPVDANLVAVATLLKQQYPAAIHVPDGEGQLPNDLLVVRRQQQAQQKSSTTVVVPDTMVFLPPPPLRETVSDLTNVTADNDNGEDEKRDCLDEAATRHVVPLAGMVERQLPPPPRIIPAVTTSTLLPWRNRTTTTT